MPVTVAILLAIETGGVTTGWAMARLSTATSTSTEPSGLVWKVLSGVLVSFSLVRATAVFLGRGSERMSKKPWPFVMLCP